MSTTVNVKTLRAGMGRIVPLHPAAHHLTGHLAAL